MDSDLTGLTRDGKKNLFFKELSDSLAGVGFTVIRYHKRSYQLEQKAKSDPSFTNSPRTREFLKNPLRFFVEDAKACVAFVRRAFPTAKVYLLGHGQGTYVALQVAQILRNIDGVALVGFALSPTDILVFEQTIYRPLRLFDKLDRNGDEELDATEIQGNHPLKVQLRGQKVALDLDEDGKISRLEFKAGRASELVLGDPGRAALLRRQESIYPRVSDILKLASFKVIFFQGLWDNQTPAYNAKSVELVSRRVWRKDNFRFVYFPGLGHALDRRMSYDDLEYDTIAPEARDRLARELAEYFAAGAR
jgi:pimeloyl-ACP methyl ester carboxylesterase